MGRITIGERFQLIDTSLNYLKQQVWACIEDGMDGVCYANTIDSEDREVTRQYANDVINSITQMLDSLENR